jgi:hypothetical protein
MMALAMDPDISHKLLKKISVSPATGLAGRKNVSLQ